MTGLDFSRTALAEARRLATAIGVPWDALPGQMEEIGGGEWRLVDRPSRLAHTFTLAAVRR